MRVDWCVSSWFRIKNSLSLQTRAMTAAAGNRCAPSHVRLVHTAGLRALLLAIGGMLLGL